MHAYMCTILETPRKVLQVEKNGAQRLMIWYPPILREQTAFLALVWRSSQPKAENVTEKDITFRPGIL